MAASHISTLLNSKKGDMLHVQLFHPTPLIPKKCRVHNLKITGFPGDYGYKPNENPNLFIEFAKINTNSPEDTLRFVSKNGFLLEKDCHSFQEDYLFFISEVKLANKVLSLFDAVINKKNGISTLKERIKVQSNPEWDNVVENPDPKKEYCIDQIAEFVGITEPRFIINIDGEEFNQMPHVIKIGAETITKHAQHPYDKVFNKFNRDNDDHWRMIALDYIGKITYEKIKAIHLSFNGINHNESITGLSIVPCLYCPDLLALMYYRFYQILSSPELVRECQNPSCKKLFKPRSHKEKYCSECRFDEHGLKRYPSQSNWNKTHLRKTDGKRGRPRKVTDGEK